MQTGTDWGGDYSRFSFDELKRHVAMLKEQGKVVLDDEFNVAQEILHTLGRRLIQDGFGDGAVGDGWKIFGTGASNNFTITGGDGTAAGAGHVYVNGILVVLPSNITYSAQEIAGPALTTPSGARTDEVYIDVWLDEYGPADDATIIDPTLGTETSRRLRAMYMVRVAEGDIMPANYVDATGITHYTCLLARINRTATAAINSGMVVDARPKFTWNRANIDYVLSQASIVPARADYTQLYDALVVLIAMLAPPVPTATTTVQGKVELATNAETQAGTDATRAVTPAGLFAAAVQEATANRIVRRNASGRAQVVDPIAAADIATKAYVDIAFSAPDLYQDGWAKFPGGLIIQWGHAQINTKNTTETITFPIPFPTSARWAIAGLFGSFVFNPPPETEYIRDVYMPVVHGFDATGMRVEMISNRTSGGTTITWLAIGF